MYNFHGIFTWSDWDMGGSDDIKIFYNVELLMSVGGYEAGTKFDKVYWDGLKLKLYTCWEDTEGIKFGLVPS
jgi:hypothetical protein